MAADRKVAVLASDPPELLELRGRVGVVGGVENCTADPLKPPFSEGFNLRPLVGSDLGGGAVYHRDPCRRTSFRSILEEGKRIFFFWYWRAAPVWSPSWSGGEFGSSSWGAALGTPLSWPTWTRSVTPTVRISGRDVTENGVSSPS